MVTKPAVDRVAQVWTRLQSVTDPELDESVTDLGFVTRVEVDADGQVQIGFRLPTYWCAANFAFLMADDMRRAVAGLPWVTKVTVELGEHMYAAEINGGVPVAAIHPPEYGHWRKAMLEDIAIVTGGRVIARDLGGKLATTELRDLGSARQVRISAK